jgi:hypothetical protein
MVECLRPTRRPYAALAGKRGSCPVGGEPEPIGRLDTPGRQHAQGPLVGPMHPTRPELVDPCVNHSELLLRDVAKLRTAHATGTWRPLPAETALADRLTPPAWTAPLLQSALRDAAPEVAGRTLARVLETAATALQVPSIVDRPELTEALAQLRQLFPA